MTTPAAAANRSRTDSDAADGGAPGHRGRGRPSRARGRAITDTIVTTALRLFVTNGYDATSMKRIGEEAGVAPNTLYLRFPDKEALFRTLIEWKVASWKVTNPLRRAHAGAGLVEILEVSALAILEAMTRDDVAAIGRLLAIESERFPELARIYRDSAMHVGRDELLDRIRTAPDSDMTGEEAEDLLTTLTEVVVGHMNNRMFRDPGEPANTRIAAKRIARVICTGYLRPS